MLTVASTVLQALEETHAYLSPTAPLTPIAKDIDGVSTTDAGNVALDEARSGPLLISQPRKLRNAQLHLLNRLALLILRPSKEELEDAKRFVAFFLFGTTYPQCLQPLVEQEEEHPDGLVYTADNSTNGNGNSSSPTATAAVAAAAAAAAAAEITALITPRSAKARNARNA